jgi:hypothetical protein
MYRTTDLPAKQQTSGELRLRISSTASKLLWALIVTVTIVNELIPIPRWTVATSYLFYAAKIICFFALGYLAPLAFLRFNALNRGILLATFSATCVETLQGFWHHGHSFHWYELAGKLALILVGFALALDARYEGMISIGPIRLRLIGERTDL